MNNGQIHPPVRIFSWARKTNCALLIVAASIILYGTLARVFEDRRTRRQRDIGEDLSGSAATRDFSVPPLQPFSRTSPRFVHEITLPALLACPTPGLTGEPEFLASEGFDEHTGPVGDFINRFRRHPHYFRHMQQPEQTMRFVSGLPIAAIYSSLEAHFKSYALLRDPQNSSGITKEGIPTGPDGSPLDTWTEATWQAYFFAPGPYIRTGTKSFSPTFLHIEFHQRTKDEGTGTPLATPRTEVEIHFEEYKYPGFCG